MIRFKLCKGYNTVEIEFDPRETNVCKVKDILDNYYGILPEQKEDIDKPTAKQISYAKALGISDAEKMTKQELQKAIKDAKYYDVEI